MRKIEKLTYVVGGAALAVAFVVACPGGKDTGETAHAGSSSSGRAVVEKHYLDGTWSSGTLTGDEIGGYCYSEVSYGVLDYSGCCPTGFSAVGTNHNGIQGTIVCLED